MFWIINVIAKKPNLHILVLDCSSLFLDIEDIRYGVSS